MKEEELKKVASIYFGITPTPKISKDMVVFNPGDIEGDVEGAKNIKIKWENHIGTESKVARITSLDIMYYMRLKYTRENLRKAEEVLKGVAKLRNLPLVKIGDRYLLINSKHRR